MSLIKIRVTIGGEQEKLYLDYKETNLAVHERGTRVMTPIGSIIVDTPIDEVQKRMDEEESKHQLFTNKEKGCN